MSSKNQLPRVLCLHGAGSSGAIYRVQGRKLFHPLRREFQFVFVDAPFPSTAGPGMYPAYADSGPFFRWQCDMSAASSFDITEEEVNAETEKVWKHLEVQLRSSNGGPFVGLMAFSQGARVATGLLLHLEEKRRNECSDLPEIKFIILNNATYPPLFFDLESWATDSADGSWADDSSDRSTDGRSSGERRVAIPSIHTQGLNDPWRPESEKMRVTYFEEDCSIVMPFTGGHQMPALDREANTIVDAIRKVASQTLLS
ncbi:citrinin biosynthesis oxidoreductase CtnB [Arthroderma uncinatum]|uniref:citrinin biosynthesis oxidoreductase CtnB n=1 Tax=Arthroderma uncinatum TaxID=74035 RepID=UPI00144ADEF6|nr:citrinin biosynthesis oxidoreductase CtnB [Arthroderma uncinatum]KAF3480346.1 citrinin biosynthesis oxidoreductase CtnB [Arthroderma uncinatum]